MTKALIINADDLGYDPAVTRGILEAMDRGVVSSTTMMVNGPHSEDAAALARGRSVGLHLNLARWPPVSNAFPEALLLRGELSEPVAERLPADVVEREALGQLDRLEALLGAAPTHVDVHKHLHRHPGIFEGLRRAARARGLPVRALDAPMREMLRADGVATPSGFVGDAGVEPYWTLDRLRAALAALPEGLTELMCHPGHAPASIQSGYSWQRETELATFTHPDARRWLNERGIALVDFRALAPRS
jgi:chitin disaccharide deacetylase